MEVSPKGRPLYFRSSGRIIKILGRESISNPMIALLEMIKNSYDADSTEVTITFDKIDSTDTKIIIKDNGLGMSLDEFDHIWMTAAIDNKEREPTTKKFNRQKIGEKGIARFGLDNLARIVEIRSSRDGDTNGFKLVIDWSEFEKSDARFETIPLIPEFFEKKKSDHGFEIILSNLRNRWDAEDIINLKKEAEAIVPPGSQAENFVVRIRCHDVPELNDIKIRNAFLKQAVYTFSAELNREGKLTYWLTTKGKKKRYGPSTPARKYKCGPALFKFYFLYRDAGKYDKLLFSIEKIKKFLDDWGGIKLYRDDFRVKPYGDPGNDWLGFDEASVQNPSLRPRNNQVFGFIEITRKYNPRLIDTTTREGLIKNEEFDDLLHFVNDAMYFFTYTRKVIEGKRTGEKQHKKAVTKIPKKLVKEAETTLERELEFDFDKNKIPEEIRDSLIADVDEMKACFSVGSHRAALMFCGLILETMLARKYFEKAGVDPIQENWKIGLLIGKCKDTGVIGENESQLADIANIINKARIRSVHKKTIVYMPSYQETVHTIGLTNSILKTLFK